MFYQVFRTNGPAQLEKKKIQADFEMNLMGSITSERGARLKAIIKYTRF